MIESTCLPQKAKGKHGDTAKADSRPELDSRIGLISGRGTGCRGLLGAGVAGGAAAGAVVYCKSENRGDAAGECLHCCYTRVEKGTDAFAAGVLP